MFRIPVLLILLAVLVASHARAQSAGETFRDCPTCPEMIVVPSGSFMMGSNRTDEKPVHEVTIAKPFAVGRYEVTFDEWDACVTDGGCNHKPGDEGQGRGKRPVINVSWNDITQQYLPWLSQKTGQSYRLLSEAEWEYAARAGSTTDYSWGSNIGTGNANCDIRCGNKWDGKQAPVGSFKSNDFGLHDMHGNVWEWVQDCYKDGYEAAPVDGSAVTSGKCARRVLRGGSWKNPPLWLRSAYRNWLNPGFRTVPYGFRVARMIAP